MRICYKQLWKTLIDKEMSKTELREKIEMSSATLAKLKKNQVVSLSSILRICEALDCDISEVLVIEKENKDDGNK